MNKIPKVGMKVGREATREKRLHHLDSPDTCGHGHIRQACSSITWHGEHICKQLKQPLNFRIRGMAPHAEDRTVKGTL